MLCIRCIIRLHHGSVINAVHPWLNAISHQYVAKCCASGINMAVHHAIIWLNAVHHASIILAQFASMICIMHQYGSVLCASMLCIHGSLMCIRDQYGSMPCTRHQCGCTSIISSVWARSGSNYSLLPTSLILEN